MEQQFQQIISSKILESKYNITQFENDTDAIPLSIIETALSADVDIVQANIGKMLMDSLNINNFFGSKKMF